MTEEDAREKPHEAVLSARDYGWVLRFIAEEPGIRERPLGKHGMDAGPPTILTKRDELRMNHDHSLRTNMSTWQMWHS